MQDFDPLASVLADLRSGEAELQAAGLEKAAELVCLLIDETMLAYAGCTAKLGLAERFSRFGPAIVPSLESFMRTSQDDDAKTWVAIALVDMGSHAGTPHLLRVFEQNPRDELAIAVALSKAHCLEARAPIEQALRNWPVARNPYGAFTLVGALRAFGPLPEELKQTVRAQSPDPFRKGFEKLFDE